MPAVVMQTKKTALLRHLAAAGILVVGTYLSELLHLLEKPLFSLYYYGNGNAAIYSLTAAVYIFLFLLLSHEGLKKLSGCEVFGKKGRLSLRRRGVLYAMTVIPVLVVAVCLNYRFKLVLELGQRLSAMSVLGNATGYLLKAARIFAAVYAIFLVDAGAEPFLGTQKWLPVGGLFAMVTFGVLEWVFVPSRFSLMYLVLFLYYGVLAKVAQKRFAVTYALALALYIL